MLFNSNDVLGKLIQLVTRRRFLTQTKKEGGAFAPPPFHTQLPR